MARLGVELGTRTIRAVRLEGWRRVRAGAVEIAWDRESPEEAVQALGKHLGAARRSAVAVDLPLLFTKRVKLPALPAAERRRILRLEPERFFAVRADELVPAVRADERSEEHTSELQSRLHLVCRLLLGKKKKFAHDSHTFLLVPRYLPALNASSSST